MESEKNFEQKQTIHSENVKIIEWESFEQELARLWSLSSALHEANEKKISLQNKLESLIQVRAESLNRKNEIEVMREKVESRRLVMGNLLMRSKVAKEDVNQRDDQLCFGIRSLLVAARVVSLAHKQLQEADRLLAGEKGYGHLKNLQKMLRIRVQYMVSQVSALYPLQTSGETAHGEKLDSSSVGNKLGNSARSKPGNSRHLTILGLRQTALPLRKTSFFSDKKEIQRSATALGYVSHVVLLIAAYLDVPLRYPLRLGGSRSYIIDYAPSLEPASLDSSPNLLRFTDLKPTEFPLFLQGQDTTRATYAIFLLNKDIEQLLSFIGIQSLGPRHLLANLKVLLRTILSQEYVDA